MRVRVLILAATVAAVLPVAAGTPGKIPIANEGAILAKWSPIAETIARPAYPETYARAQPQVCLTVGYLLNADGHTSDFALLKSWSSKDNSRPELWSAFAGNASQALAQWRFKPKPGVAAPAVVYTAATMVFGPGDAAATRAHCAMPDIASRVIELRRDPRAARLMASGIFPKLDISRDLELKYEIAEQQTLVRDGNRQDAMARQDQLNEIQRQQMQQQQGSSGNK